MKSRTKQALILMLLAFGLFGCQQTTPKEDAAVKQPAEEMLVQHITDSLTMIYIAELAQIDEAIGQIEATADHPFGDSEMENPYPDAQTLIAKLAEIKLHLEENKANLRKSNVQLEQKSQALRSSESKKAVLLDQLKKERLYAERLKARNNTLLAEGAAKEDEIARLLFDLDMQLAKTNLLMAKLEKLDQKQNEVYYVMGTSKDLKQKGILEKKGGLWGVGGAKVMNVESPDSLFHPLHKAKDKQLVLEAPDVKIVTAHPEDSYIIRSDTAQMAFLEIKDPEEFWKASRYLVIVQR